MRGARPGISPQLSWLTRAVCGFILRSSGGEQAGQRAGLAGWLTLAPLRRTKPRRAGPGPDSAPKTRRQKPLSRPLAALLGVRGPHTEENPRPDGADLNTNSPRMRKQKLHNNRLRSTTPIFPSVLGPAAARSSAPCAHRCGRVLGGKMRIFRTIVGSWLGRGAAQTIPAPIPAAWLPGCLLTALDQLSVSHIVLQEIRRLLPL